MKAVNHQLNWMMDKTLLDFVPAKQDVLRLGGDLRACTVPSIDAMYLLRIVSCQHC